MVCEVLCRTEGRDVRFSSVAEGVLATAWKFHSQLASQDKNESPARGHKFTAINYLGLH